ncbi:MAG TPA: PEGA domain-containing protein [Candidatus Saccharimonadales bacterium]
MSPKKTKRSELAWRSVRYGMMVVTIGVLSFVLLFVMLGYRFNSDRGTFQQGGLVQFISKPDGARVTVGSANLANRTRSKITLIPGDYLVKMERDGYELWQKNISVHAGKVLWLSSARLVPKDLKTEDVLSLKGLASSSTRTNGRYMALLEDGTKPIIKRVSLSDGDLATRDIILPEESYQAGKKHVFRLGDWSSDDRHILLKHSYDKRNEWLLVNTDSVSETIAIPAIGKIDPVDVIYDPRSDSNLVVRYSDGTVRLIDGSSGNATETILKNVDTIQSFSNSILYTSSPEPGKVEVGYLTLDKSIPRVLATYTTKKPVYAAMSRYFGDFYLTTSVGADTTIEGISQLTSSDDTRVSTRTVVASFKTPKDVFSISVENAGRFIVFSEAEATSVYDLELEKLTSASIDGAKKPLVEPLSWVDDQHFLSSQSGWLRQYEFDGANQANIVQVVDGTSAGYSPDGTYLYSIAKVGQSFTLQRTRMILQ